MKMLNGNGHKKYPNYCSTDSTTAIGTNHHQLEVNQVENLQQFKLDNNLTKMINEDQQQQQTQIESCLNHVESKSGEDETNKKFKDSIHIDIGSDEEHQLLNKDQPQKQLSKSTDYRRIDDHHLSKYQMRVTLPSQISQVSPCDSHIDISLTMHCILKSPNYNPIALTTTSIHSSNNNNNNNNHGNNSSSDDTIEAAILSSSPYSGARRSRLLSTGASTRNNRSISSTPMRSRARSNSARLYDQLRSPQGDSSRDMSASQSVAFCENNLLSKYNLVLKLIGWRPFISSVSKSELYCCAQLLNYLYVLMIASLLLVGYVLQYASCFRQDNIRAYVMMSASISQPADPVDHTFSDILDNDRILGQNILDAAFPNDSLASNTIQQQTRANSDAVNNLTDLLSKGIDQLIQLFTDNQHDHSHSKYQCTGGFSSYYFIPSVLHIVAFVTMMCQMRVPEADRFHNLCVQSYIMLSKVSGLDKARQKLAQSILHWLLVGLLCLVITFSTHLLHIFLLDEICFTFLHPSDERYLLAMKLASLFLFTLIDLACIAIIVTYSLHCQLNIIFLKTNETAMREKRINFGTFTKNTEECKISIDFLNSSISLGVSILLIHFASRLVVAMIDMVGKQSNHQYSSTILALLSVIFWAVLVITPLVQAARVTEACASIKHIGHELRARPFCYQTEPYADLDSLLSYTSTLNLNARILTISVRSSCIATIILLFIFSFLILGQVNLINLKANVIG